MLEVRIFGIACLLYLRLAMAEDKDCDPKKDSGCMKFTRPFYPDECWAAFPGGPNCTRFDPMKSKTLKYVDKGMFLLQYADNSALKGYEARDVVQLGDYFTFTKFGWCPIAQRLIFLSPQHLSWKKLFREHDTDDKEFLVINFRLLFMLCANISIFCNYSVGIRLLGDNNFGPGGITVCNSPDFQRVNGILGFGLPQEQHVMTSILQCRSFFLTVFFQSRFNFISDPSRINTICPCWPCIAEMTKNIMSLQMLLPDGSPSPGLIHQEMLATSHAVLVSPLSPLSCRSP
jgi:hypothetical protein